MEPAEYGKRIDCGGCGRALRLPSDVVGRVECVYCHHDDDINGPVVGQKSGSTAFRTTSHRIAKPASSRYHWTPLVLAILAAGVAVYFVQRSPVVLSPEVDKSRVSIPASPPKMGTSDTSPSDPLRRKEKPDVPLSTPSSSIEKPDIPSSASSKVSAPTQTSLPAVVRRPAKVNTRIPIPPDRDSSNFVQPRVASPLAPPTPPPTGSEQLPQQWPPTTGELRGPNQIRLENPHDVAVLVGIRSADKGKDITIQPHSVFFAWIPNGEYEIYLHYHNEPGVVRRVERFTLRGRGMVLKLVKGSTR